MLNTLQQLRDGSLAGSRRVKLACGLKEFPVDLFALAETLEILDLSGNQFSSLPEDLPRLQRLKIIFCSDNQFETLPTVLGQCPQLEMIGFKANRIRHLPAEALPPNLRWLILTDNRIEVLPEALGDCHALQKLMLAGNRLRDLPAAMAQLHRLELLRIAANQLDTLPDWLLTLPRLSWLAYAGNPFCQAPSQQSVPSIHWDRLKMSRQLGEGASGVIHEATWQATGHQAVAVKLFKGQMTSDGLPECEMKACLQAGQHPHLIPVLGKIEQHPEQRAGLVLERIDPAFRNLAAPPSLTSCTRDIYPEHIRFNLENVLDIARGMASAAAHLHEQGILHGDLYAHNILYLESGHALLGDFGAASFFETNRQPQAQRLQALEVRAFACLLEELLLRCESHAGNVHVLSLLQHLQNRCAHDSVDTRPLFDEILQTLNDLPPG